MVDPEATTAASAKTQEAHEAKAQDGQETTTPVNAIGNSNFSMNKSFLLGRSVDTE